jgi:hypothetical protein
MTKKYASVIPAKRRSRAEAGPIVPLPYGSRIALTRVRDDNVFG